MSIDDLKTVERLSKIVLRMTSNPALREDLMQEALIHLWQVQEQRPGQAESWYFQSCRYHLQHYVASGRSVDSPKRSSSQIHPVENGEDTAELFDILISLEPYDAVLADVSARDIIDAMSKLLSERERVILVYLAEGLGTCDIAKRLNISHPMVIKHRRKIAALATKLAIDPLPNKSRNGKGRRKKKQEAALHQIESFVAE
jgi:RNA polymerase sigma factor (sigma-70 family)